MGNDWTLLIDIRTQTQDYILVTMSLLNSSRKKCWVVNKRVDINAIQDLQNQIFECFGNVNQKAIFKRIRKLSESITRDFQINTYLTNTRLEKDDSIVISTMATNVPWDLVLFKDSTLLANYLSVGLDIPTHDREYFTQGSYINKINYRGDLDRKQRFLHIISDPLNNLINLDGEVENLKTLVHSHDNLEYSQLVNPTPKQVLAEFREYPNTPYIHFSGHVQPRQGLLLSRESRSFQSDSGLFSIELIKSRFPQDRDQIVFLNGCDALWDYQKDEEGGIFDSFQIASVANAFLDAGANAVIAPRSRIKDSEACHAASTIWADVLNEVPLGTAVRNYRKRQVEEQPDSISGYSYILYGSPTVRIAAARPKFRTAGLQKSDISDGIPENELLLEAARDANGPVSPGHIFATLTRRWVIGHAFFQYAGQSYIYELAEIRSILRTAQDISMRGPVLAIELTSGGQQLLQRLHKTVGSRELDEFSFLMGIRELGDPEIIGALKSLDRGPLSVETLGGMAEAWREKGSPDCPAVVLPCGLVDNSRLLAGIRTVGHFGPDKKIAEASIGKWALFVAMLLAESRIAHFWKELRYPTPTDPEWLVGERLHWNMLDSQGRRALIDAAHSMEQEQASAIGEAHFLEALLVSNPLLWTDLDAKVQQWLQSFGFTAEEWKSFIKDVGRESLGWF